jgi:WD40 repeat protein
VGECPYKGLSAFQEVDAPFYFGRESFVDALEQAIRARKLVAVIVGSSGSGKSSALLAGLLPRLRKEAGNQFAILRPSSQPFYALAGAIMPLLEPGLSEIDRLIETRKLAEALTKGEVSLPQVVRRILEKTPATRQVVLIIDQFEELYTLCPEEQAQKALIDELLATVAIAKESRAGSVVILLTLRADFMGQALAYRPFADALQDASLLMGPMTRQELHQAIEKPAEMQGAAFEAGLVERILDDVGEKPGNLPLLEFTLTQLWERQTDGWLTHADYEAMGCIEGALASYADQVYEQLTPEEQEHARRALELLVQPGEGTEDTRRIATHEELGDENWTLIRRLADRRLVVTGRDAQGRETAEVVHEALIQKWGRFQEWLSQDRENLRLHRHLAEAAEEWLRSEKDASLLYRGARLAQAREWSDQYPGALNQQEQEFLQASVEESQREAAEQEAQRQRELEAARQLAETQAQAARRLRRRAIYLGLALVAAFGMVLVAIVFAQQSNQSRQVALAREWAVAAMNNLTIDSQRSILLAMQAVNTADLPETENALHQAVQASRLRDSVIGHSGFIYGLAFHPDGRQFATASGDGTIKIWTLDESGLKIGPTPVMTITNPIEPSMDNYHSGRTLEYSPDGMLLAAVAEKNTVNIWDASNGQLLHNLQGYTNMVICLAFSPDGKLLAAGNLDNTVRIWDVNNGEEIQILRHSTGIAEVAWSSDGKRLATGSSDDSLVTIWNRPGGSGRNFSFAYSFDSQVGCSAMRIAFSPDDQQLAVQCMNIYTFDISHASAAVTPLLLHTFTGHKQGSMGLTYTPNGASLVSGSADGTIKIWDTATGQERYTLPANSSWINAFALNPDGRALLSASGDHTIKLWDFSISGNQEWFAFPGLTCIPPRAISPDMKYMAIAPGQVLSKQFIKDLGLPPWIDIYELTSSGAREVRKINTGYDQFRATYSRDFSRAIITGPETQGIRIFDMATGQELKWIDTSETDIPDKPSNHPFAVDLSPDDNRIAIGYLNGMALIWDLATGQMLYTLTSPDAPISMVQFSPDGTLLAIGTGRLLQDSRVRIWDLTSKTVIAELRTDNPWFIFSSDGKTILIAQENTAILYDLKTFQPVYTFHGHSNVLDGMAFSPDGRYLATQDIGRVIKIWETETRKEILTFTGVGPWFTPDSKHLIVCDNISFSVYGYFLDIDDLMQLARSRLVRTWTLDECQKFLSMDTCPPTP